jgi:N-acetylglucosamine-6-phosphate deacetylase
MNLLTGADIVLPDRILTGGTILIDGNHIAAVGPRTQSSSGLAHLDLQRHYIVPGFIDVHVHGVEGDDCLDSADAIARIALKLTRHGVTSFCPTSIACSPAALRVMLDGVRLARANRESAAARVLPAHLESNFISPEFNGAQPLECLRVPSGGKKRKGAFTGKEILDEIAAARDEVGIVTIAPEIDGALTLISDLVLQGHHVSLGHSGATYEQAMAGIAAGARQATHLFNRMPPIGHREPGLAGAVLDDPEVVAEIICDGVHVHPVMVRMAVAAKKAAGIMAITDGTAGSGCAPGTKTTIGGRRITVGDVARLDDGTIAGSVLTMDRAFANLVNMMGFSLVDAATMCATSPARALGLVETGTIAPGQVADLVVLDREFNVTHTFIGGNLAWSR